MMRLNPLFTLVRNGVMLVGLGLAGSAANAADWLAAYVAPQGDPADERSSGDVTIRQIIRFEAAGSSVRIVLGNQRGIDPVQAAHLRIVLYDSANRLIPDSARSLTFGGDATDKVSVPARTSVASNPVSLSVLQGQTAAITTYYPAQSAHAVDYVKESYWARGDHSADATPITSHPGGGLRGTLQRVEVMATVAKQVLVTIGDSITAGYQSTAFAHKSYPEQLTDRFARTAGGREWSVVNAGISGNRVLHNNNGPCLLSRFGRDALQVPGVKAVLVLEGINDIGSPISNGGKQTVTADQIKTAYRMLIKQTHARGVRIYFGTILPYGGAFYYSTEGEAIRTNVNAWIRSNKEADGYVEFAQALRDPGVNPPQIKPDRTGDKLHPNDAGYGLMADQVLLQTIERSTSTSVVGDEIQVTQRCLTD